VVQSFTTVALFAYPVPNRAAAESAAVAVVYRLASVPKSLTVQWVKVPLSAYPVPNRAA
jgi:hypothetical protein